MEEDGAASAMASALEAEATTMVASFIRVCQKICIAMENISKYYYVGLNIG